MGAAKLEGNYRRWEGLFWKQCFVQNNISQVAKQLIEKFFINIIHNYFLIIMYS